MSPSQQERVERYVARRYPADEHPERSKAEHHWFRAGWFQGAWAQEQTAVRIALTDLDPAALRRMSLIRRFVKNLDSEEWFRMTSVARNPQAVRSELLKARTRSL